MSSITKEWNEEDFRKELRRLDQYVKRSQGVDLVGGELDIEYSERARCTLGMYYPKEKKFKFHFFSLIVMFLKLVQLMLFATNTHIIMRM